MQSLRRTQVEDGEHDARYRLEQAVKQLMAELPEDSRGPKKFEQEALKLTTQPGHTPALAAAFKGYTEAVNAYWLFAEGAGISRKLAMHFMKKYRKPNFRRFDDVSADATMAMRRICVLHAVSATKAPLWVFAFQRMLNALLEANAEAAGVPIDPNPKSDGGHRNLAFHANRYRTEADTFATEDGERREYEGLAASPEDELLEREEATGVSVWGHRV